MDQIGTSENLLYTHDDINKFVYLVELRIFRQFVLNTLVARTITMFGSWNENVPTDHNQHYQKLMEIPRADLDQARYVLGHLQQKMEEEDRPYTSRYIGSLVSDFHRNMIKGGIYIYPNTSKNPEGKLRLLYECNPMAFIVEQAGGRASNGKIRILEVQPDKLHQRMPIFIGSEEDVRMVEKFMAESEVPVK